MTDIQLFQILKQKFGEKEAEALVQFVANKLKEINEQNLKVIATREDVANPIGELKAEIANAKVETIRWTFGFFVAMMLAILGLYFKH